MDLINDLDLTTGLDLINDLDLTMGLDLTTGLDLTMGLDLTTGLNLTKGNARHSGSLLLNRYLNISLGTPGFPRRCRYVER